MSNTIDPRSGATPGGAAESRVVRESMHQAKESARGAWSDARQTARASLEEHKNTAAERIGDVADALRDASRRGEAEGERDRIARLTGSAADGLERFSQALRSKDVGTMLRDVESFARSQPVAFFGVALAVGFLAVRLMKSGDPGEGEQPW
jgi:hypothetical protein